MSKSKLSITKDLQPLLLKDAGLKKLVDGKIFPLYAPEDTDGDFVIYARTDYGSQLTMMGVADEWCEVTYNAVSKVYLTSLAIAERIRAVLQDVTVDGEPIILGKTREDFVGEGNQLRYVQILPFEIGKNTAE
jgi:hypothetical protein